MLPRSFSLSFLSASFFLLHKRKYSSGSFSRAPGKGLMWSFTNENMKKWSRGQNTLIRASIMTKICSKIVYINSFRNMHIVHEYDAQKESDVDKLD